MAKLTKAKDGPLENRTLLVLGAGASIAAAKYPIYSSTREAFARMPSGANFFHDLFAVGPAKGRNHPPMNMLGLMSPGLNELIVRAWALSNNLEKFEPEEWRRIGIEEVFTFLDIGERMYPRGTQYHRGFSVCKRELEAFITTILANKSDEVHCEYLADILWRLGPTDSIVSFNWDTIADFTLEYTNCPAYAGYLAVMEADPLRVSDFVKRGVFLKLHGSLNWTVCTNPQCTLHRDVRLVMKGGKLSRYIETPDCPVCGAKPGEPFIVPPTSQKLIRRGTKLHKLWLLAREQLACCKRIVFIGYSFPTTDFYSEWLFRQIHFLEGELPTVVVVNPEIMKPRSAVSKRYQDIFRGCRIEKIASLEEFAGRG